ncbi:hypothetical protein GCM10009563_30280 [Subtercola frigoramans]
MRGDANPGADPAEDGVGGTTRGAGVGAGVDVGEVVVVMDLSLLSLPLILSIPAPWPTVRAKVLRTVHLPWRPRRASRLSEQGEKWGLGDEQNRQLAE